MTQATNNPFFGKFKTPFETPPFDQIKVEHYEPAFDEAIKRLDKEVKAIAENPQPATFENTIVALERSGQLLNTVSSVFFNVLSAEANDEMMEISQRVSPKLSEVSNNIYLNDKLFARVRDVYEQKERLDLSTEDAKLLEETYLSFKTQGATLSPEKKERYRTLSTELSVLTLQFDQNALKDQNRFEMLITDKSELAGLPESIQEAAAALAKSKGKEGWLINLSAPSYVPFMRYSDRRDLREKLYRAYMSVGAKGDEFDNQEIIRKIVNIRLEIAQLMGHKNYAEYVQEHKMAKNPTNVYKLLNQLLEAYKPVAINEYNTVEGFALGMEQKDITVMPWDWNYYSEKVRHIRFDVNDEMTRPYFELDNVKKGIFGLATQLYGITFKANKAIPVYHPEVEAFEVYDADGSFLAILYTDFFPREGKQSGAWMNNIKSQYKTEDGTDSRPQISSLSKHDVRRLFFGTAFLIQRDEGELGLEPTIGALLRSPKELGIARTTYVGHLKLTRHEGSHLLRYSFFSLGEIDRVHQIRIRRLLDKTALQRLFIFHLTFKPLEHNNGQLTIDNGQWTIEN